MERQIGRVGIYFRFSVEQGMQSNLLGPVADPSQVAAQTKNCLAEQGIREKIGDFVCNFDAAARLITVNQLGLLASLRISRTSPYVYRIRRWLNDIHPVGDHSRGDIGCLS